MAGRPLGDHQQKREDVAKATWVTIAKQGLHNTSLQSIADELQCTTGALRHYFRTKAELLLFAKNSLFDRARSRMRGAARRGHGLARLASMLSEGLPLDDERILMWRIYLAFQGHTVGDPALTARQHQSNCVTTRLFAEEIKRLQEERVIAAEIDAHSEALAAQCFIDGLSIAAIMATQTFTPSLQRKLLERYVLRAFAPASGYASSATVKKTRQRAQARRLMRA